MYFKINCFFIPKEIEKRKNKLFEATNRKKKKKKKMTNNFS